MDTSELPTKNNLIRLQGKINLSKQGQELLEKKKIILNIEKNKYQNRKKELEIELQDILQKAYIQFKKASINVGMDNLKDIANKIKIYDNIDIKYISIMGVEIPSIIFEKQGISLDYGLYKTTTSVDKTIVSLNNIKYMLIRLAELENIIYILNKNISKVQKRSNALKDIIIPNDERIVSEIKNILEERDREEFSRLKVIKNKKFF